ncbi:hypothetical protein WJX72_008908 [[Myrmecia] bisecta]|uniref:Uncharacterized protein n=1 Tax=[Myrmecia] bisecta TaxID=41462 RepID=A0AAW1PC41_9CHLO
MAGALRRLAPFTARLTQPTVAVAKQLRQRFSAAVGEEAKVNAWEAPTHLSKWKEEHIVFLVLGSWAVGIYTATKVFGGKKEDPAAAPAPAAAVPAKAH